MTNDDLDRLEADYKTAGMTWPTITLEAFNVIQACPALLAECRRLRAENEQMRALAQAGCGFCRLREVQE
jgi:hypothetical protein